MESANSMFFASLPFSPGTLHSSSSSSSVVMLHEQAVPAVAYWSSSFAAQHFPTSVLLQEQRDEYRPLLLHMYKEDKTSQATSNTRQMEMGLVREKDDTDNADQLVHNFMQQLHLRSQLQNILTLSPIGEIYSSSALQPIAVDSERPVEGLQLNAVSLAKQALFAAQQAAPVAEEFKPATADDDLLPLGLASTSLADSSLGKNTIVRSKRSLERRSRQRKLPKSKILDEESYLARNSDVQERLRVEKKIKERFDQNDPLRLFLWGPETRQLLTSEEESQLCAQLQDLWRLKEVKNRLQTQFRREPTLAEWADGVGLSCPALQAQLHCGYRSREKLIHANLRMVVHIAKQYQGRGLSLQDLLQEGSIGLMKSVERFKPQVGCRFGTYAYWWIRQTIRTAIFLHSRTIRLPESLYTLLGKVLEAKKSYIQEGNLRPTNEELAERVGIKVEKLDNLFWAARIPLSMQQTVWADQDTTFQEITADTTIETPELTVEKQLMRRHVHNLLSVLTPKERRIIRLRFGIEDGHEKTLSDIGKVFSLTKERVRQLESRALKKLKKCLDSQGLHAYLDLIV